MTESHRRANQGLVPAVAVQRADGQHGQGGLERVERQHQRAGQRPADPQRIAGAGIARSGGADIDAMEQAHHRHREGNATDTVTDQQDQEQHS